MLLDGSDLRELGFPMGPRKQLLQWIKSHTSTTVSDEHSCPATPYTSDTPRRTPSTPVTPQPSQPTTSSGTRIRKFQVATLVASQQIALTTVVFWYWLCFAVVCQHRSTSIMYQYLLITTMIPTKIAEPIEVGY